MFDRLFRNTEKSLVFYDFETNGFNKKMNKPWQLAWAKIEKGHVKKIENRFLYFANYSISDEVAKINHFDRSVYESKRNDPNSKPKKVIEDFLADLGDNYLCGQNIFRFDNEVLQSCCRDMGIDFDSRTFLRCVDTSPLEKMIEKKADFNDESPFFTQLKWSGFFEKGLKTSMLHMLKKYDIEFDEAKLHDAEYDIVKNYDILKKQMYLINIPDFA